VSAARCDSCGKRVRAGHHEARLLDAETGQRIGAYHAACQGAAVGYMTLPAKLVAVFVLRILHPERCGPDLGRCDGGLAERVVSGWVKIYS
jgi:hypothetical protein